MSFPKICLYDQKHTLFSNFAPLNDVRAYSAWSWKTTLITWIFGRAWYPLDIRVAPRAYELKFDSNLGCRAENSSNFLTNFSRRSKNLIFFCLKWGSKKTESCCNWGSKERRERREKGVLTAGHTHTPFQGSVPRPPPSPPYGPFILKSLAMPLDRLVFCRLITTWLSCLAQSLSISVGHFHPREPNSNT